MMTHMLVDTVARALFDEERFAWAKQKAEGREDRIPQILEALWFGLPAEEFNSFFVRAERLLERVGPHVLPAALDAGEDDDGVRRVPFQFSAMVPAGATVRLDVKPIVALRYERLVVSESIAEHFSIVDLQLGHCLHFMRSGEPVPASLFVRRRDLVPVPIQGIIRPEEEIALTVTNNADRGLRFEGALLCRYYVTPWRVRGAASTVALEAAAKFPSR